MLKDDKHFFPSYYCATIVREETLKEHPELERILEKMNGILTDQEMADMNYKVDVEHRTEREVAVEF
ncbi:MAG: glycine betaine ABC transporter substrate-binding protein [Butyricimonas faecihominis]